MFFRLPALLLVLSLCLTAFASRPVHRPTSRHGGAHATRAPRAHSGHVRSPEWAEPHGKRVPLRLRRTISARQVGRPIRSMGRGRASSRRAASALNRGRRTLVARLRSASLAEAVAQPLILPVLRTVRNRFAMPAPLFGSHEILVHQNVMADQAGLERILNDDDLLDKRREGQLVRLPVSRALNVDPRLPPDRRFCRPWVAQFLTELAEAHFARFGTPLQVNSAVRTVEFQQKLMRRNGNAAPAEGDTASPHLTGQAVDLAKRGMSLAEIAWMRGALLNGMEAGRIDVEEEFQQSCFHISVYRGQRRPAGSPGRYLASTPATAQSPSVEASSAAAWTSAARP